MATATQTRPEEAQDTKPQAEAPRPKYVMPKPLLHQIVAWYPHSEVTALPHPAMVVEISESGVKLMLMEPGRMGQMIPSSVRHVTDPTLPANEFVRKRSGGWDFTEEEKARNEMLQQLIDRISSLEGELSKLKEELA